MREIKFRAFIDDIGYAYFNLGHSPKWYGNYSRDKSYCYTGVDKAKVIEQYIGEKDEYNTEIYDGDIMLYQDIDSSNKYGCYLKYTYLVVQWFRNGWCLMDNGKPFKRRFDKLSVVGNIHENPELLEVKE